MQVHFGGLPTQGVAMADSRGLRMVGFILGAVTAGIMGLAVAVVEAHVDGRLTFEGGQQQMALFSSADLRR